jgi:MFS family permease
MSIPASSTAELESVGSPEMRRIIFASSLGTVFEWYDFFLYGALASIIAKRFFSGVNETSAYIFALLAFAAGFAIRPLGAMVFGHLGDLIGRKYTFLATILIMGLSTFLVGVLPSYETIGVSAPILLISLRLLQGLALGGEYGGAATYVAEHAPADRRGYSTGFIQVTASVGLLLSLVVILVCRYGTGGNFDAWGWRIPFLFSAVLLGVSVYIRLQLNESPLFKRMKSEGKLSKTPLTEALGNWGNLKIMLASLFGLTAPEAVVWYTCQFYALFFLTTALKIEAITANLLMVIALVSTAPLYVVFGWVSDRIGRKTITMIGFLLAALTILPIFKGLTHYGNPALETAAATHPVTVIADPAQCSFQFDPIGKKVFRSSCDIVKSALAKSAIPYSNTVASRGSSAVVRIGTVELTAFDGRLLDATTFKAEQAKFNEQLGKALSDAGYPAKADPQAINFPMLLLLLALLGVFSTMVYASMAAWLVELFPTRIRYSSMSLPYHVGNGWFGGFVPSIAFALVSATGDVYRGLWYPIAIAVLGLIVGTLWLRNTKGGALPM